MFHVSLCASPFWLKFASFKSVVRVSDWVILPVLFSSFDRTALLKATTSLRTHCMRNAFSSKEFVQDEEWIAGKGAGALAFAATYAVIGFVTFSVGGGCCGCAFAGTKRCWQCSWTPGERNETARRRCSLEACATSQENEGGGESVCSPRQTSAEWLECESGKHSGRVPTNKGGSLIGKCERSIGDAGGNALQWSFGSACSSHSQREGYRNFCAATRRARLYAELAAFPASAGGRSPHVPECSTSRKKSERWRNEANCFRSVKTAGRTVGGVCITALLGPRCVDRCSCKLERDFSEVFPPRIQPHWGCERDRPTNEHKIAARLWSGSKQAHYDAETTQGPVIQKWAPAAEQRKTGREAIFPQI